MTVRADKCTPVERVIWVVICFVLFAAEMQAIYRDRKEFAEPIGAPKGRARAFRKPVAAKSRTLQRFVEEDGKHNQSKRQRIASVQ
jgi:hypothetical protein